MQTWYIGLLSGTSADGIDAGLFRFDGNRCETGATLTTPYPDALRRDLLEAICNPARCTVDVVGALDTRIGERFMTAAAGLLAKAGIESRRVRAIGSHGQTLRHRPDARRPFTLQVGDPNIIAAGTGIVTVADFRRRDVALGGEGAPLACAFHSQFLASPDEARAVVNIGGIANVTVLPAGEGKIAGFDTGPGNTLLDAWIGRHREQPYDPEGQWAAQGRPVRSLLDVLLRDPYFDRPPPKSTGFEHFNLGWLDEVLQDGWTAARTEDIQATLAALTARTICDALKKSAPETARVLVCGGGVHNRDLMRRLREELAPLPVDSTADFGVDPDWVEAATFAWLAGRCLDGLAGNLPEVTGATRETILGGVWYP